MADQTTGNQRTHRATGTTGTGWLHVRGGQEVDISIDIGASTTVQLQRRRGSPDAVHDAITRVVESYTTDTEKVFKNASGCEMRLVVSSYTAQTDLLMEIGTATTSS